MTRIKDSLAICLGAGLGGWCRYQLGLSLAFSTFPWANLLANWLGTYLLLVFVRGDLAQKGATRTLILASGTGFCGSFTTFSGIFLDSFKLVEQGYWLPLAFYLTLTMAGGLLIAFWCERRRAC